MRRQKILFIGRVGFYTRDAVAFLGYIICMFLVIIRAGAGFVAPLKIIIICLLAGYAAILGGQFSSFFLSRKKQKKLLPSLKKLVLLYGIGEFRLQSFGVLTGGILGTITLCGIFGISTTRFLDLIAPPCVLGMAFARIGCFFNGCCYGIQSKLPWALKFNDETRRHPTQLYLASGDLAIFGILLLIEKLGLFSGALFLEALILYSIMRFLMGFLRGNTEKKFLGGRLCAHQLLYLATGLGALSGFLILVCLKYNIAILQ
jgi:phosphatidylglycerol:prolipoprotein diacylglycerol transferase